MLQEDLVKKWFTGQERGGSQEFDVEWRSSLSLAP